MTSLPVATYAGSGVDVGEGERAVALMRSVVAKASRPEVVGGIGGFAGLFDASALRTFRRPLLASATDGVGTKVEVARRMDRHDSVGIDLVAMVVDDLVVCGAEPWLLTDYLAMGRVVAEKVESIVAGVAEGCRQAGAALVGGETAEHPGLLGPDEYDLAGAGIGVVEADAVLGPERVVTGDAVVAMSSSGLHANGYSLVRHVFLARAGWSLDRSVPELGRTLGEELLEPTRIYAKACLELTRRRTCDVHAFAHVTGGGLAANLARVLPKGVRVAVQRGTWTPPPVMQLVQQVGQVPQDDLERTLNMGVGMLAVVGAGSADRVIAGCAEQGVPAWVCGTVAAGASGAEGGCELVGTYR